MGEFVFVSGCFERTASEISRAEGNTGVRNHRSETWMVRVLESHETVFPNKEIWHISEVCFNPALTPCFFIGNNLASGLSKEALEATLCFICFLLI